MSISRVSVQGLERSDPARGRHAGDDGIYPYDGTVFPRGMVAPELMWEGAAGDVAYLHIKSQIFEYWGCLELDAAGRIAVNQDAWDQAGKRSQGKQDVYTVEVSVLAQGKVVGPISSSFHIAQAAIKGSIYYNTYASKLVGAGGVGGFPGFPGFPGGGFGGSGGVVLRIPPRSERARRERWSARSSTTGAPSTTTAAPRCIPASLGSARTSRSFEPEARHLCPYAALFLSWHWRRPSQSAVRTPRSPT
jgi:hypothetical protein